MADYGIMKKELDAFSKLYVKGDSGLDFNLTCFHGEEKLLDVETP